MEIEIYKGGKGSDGRLVHYTQAAILTYENVIEKLKKNLSRSSLLHVFNQSIEGELET